MNILVLDGDGIGPEVNGAARRVLEAVGESAGIAWNFENELFGGASLDVHGVPLTDEVVAKALACDAVLMGACGGPKWDNVAPHLRAERGLLRIRKEMGVYANLRPAKFYACLNETSPLRPERTDGADFIIVRELNSGIYFGEPRAISEDGNEGWNTMRYTRQEVERIARIGFELARNRNGRLTSVDKANVLEVMRVWRNVVTELHAAEFSDIPLDHNYVDAYAMHLVTRPKDADVIITGNMFGDILSDLAAALTGSLGMLPSASIGDGPAIYEPVHGSAPDIAGEDKANPIAAVLSAAMLLELTCKRNDLADLVRDAVEEALNQGNRTGDIFQKGEAGTKLVGTTAMTDAILANLRPKLG